MEKHRYGLVQAMGEMRRFSAGQPGWFKSKQIIKQTKKTQEVSILLEFRKQGEISGVVKLTRVPLRRVLPFLPQQIGKEKSGFVQVKQKCKLKKVV